MNAINSNQNGFIQLNARDTAAGVSSSAHKFEIVSTQAQKETKRKVKKPELRRALLTEKQRLETIKVSGPAVGEAHKAQA